MRHWFSGTFLLLTLLALPELWRVPWRIDRGERTLFVILTVFFVLFVVTALANGWSEDQTSYVSREMRFLVAIPIYLMLRRMPHAGLWLVRGGVLGGFVLLAQALYDVNALDLDRAQGVYSPNLLGPVAAFAAAFLLVLWRIDRAWRPLLLASMAAGLAALALSTSRGGYLGFLGMALAWAALRFRGRRLAVAVAGVAVVALVSYNVSDHVRTGVVTAARQLADVIGGDDVLKRNGSLPSVPARFEMWRVSLMIFRDHPLLGVGRGNYTEAARKYVEEGRVHPEVIAHSHPHSAYLEALVSKGVLGLATLLAMLLFPLYLFARGYRRSPDTATLGVLHVTGFALFSLTDGSTIVKGNYIAIWIVYLTAFLAWHARATAEHGT